jgi:hypothetical protein
VPVRKIQFRSPRVPYQDHLEIMKKEILDMEPKELSEKKDYLGASMSLSQPIPLSGGQCPMRFQCGIKLG